MADINKDDPTIEALAGKKMVRMGSWAVKDESELRPAFFSFRNVSCVLKVKGVDKTLLEGASGYCKPGESLAIMGPSGAGKSTLLDVVSFRKTTGRYTQDIMLNGELLTHRTFVKHNGYVTSDDLLSAEMTVREALEFCAALRLPNDWTSEQRKARIEDVLSVMRLNYVEHNRIGSSLVRGLSNGERKRVNVAVELLPVSAVVFLDEPTTGLDSNTGREIIENTLEVIKLRKLACVATIHQPSYTILRQFDGLMLLAQGKMVYFGATKDAIEYFQSYLGIPVHGNPAEIYADALAASPERCIEAWDKSPEKGILVKAIDAIHTGQGSIRKYAKYNVDDHEGLADKLGFFQQAPSYMQIYQLFLRQVRIYLRNSVMTTSRFLAGLASALFFGMAYIGIQRSFRDSNGRLAIIFCIVVICPGFGSAAIAYWLEKRKQFYHEEAAGYYHRLWYVAAQYIVEAIFLSLFMAVSCLIMCGMTNFYTEFYGHYILYWTLESWAATGWNLCSAYMSASIPYANAAFTVHFFYSILMCGFYILNYSLYVKPGGSFLSHFLVWTSYSRPTFMSMARNEYWGKPMNCSYDNPFEWVPLEITHRVYDGLSTGSLTIMNQTVKNPTLISTITAAGDWEYATAAQNATLKQVFTLSNRLMDSFTASQTIANLTAAGVAVAADAAAFASSQLTADLAAFSSYTGISATPQTAAIAAAKKLLAVEGMVNYSEFLLKPGNNLTDADICVWGPGTTWLTNGLGMFIFKTETLANGTEVTVPDIDHPDVTPNWLLQLDAFLQGVVCFILAYLLLKYCNFRLK